MKQKSARSGVRKTKSKSRSVAVVGEPPPVKHASHFIVGVGASAGGLEALGKLFSTMPADSGLSFVVVQHLSPDYKSFMVELLSKRTSVPVLRAES